MLSASVMVTSFSSSVANSQTTVNTDFPDFPTGSTSKMIQTSPLPPLPARGLPTLKSTEPLSLKFTGINSAFHLESLWRVVEVQLDTAFCITGSAVDQGLPTSGSLELTWFTATQQVRRLYTGCTMYAISQADSATVSSPRPAFRVFYNHLSKQHKIGKDGRKVKPLSGPFTRHLVNISAPRSLIMRSGIFCSRYSKIG